MEEEVTQVYCTPRLPEQLRGGGNFKEIGDDAEWVLSSCKPGYGVYQLRDGSLDTYWQSDGSQPHLLSLLFPRKTSISHVCVYTNVKRDESYTPNRIGIRIGSAMCDTVQQFIADASLPNGWMVIPLHCTRTNRPFIRAFVLQIAILQNHQNGRDSHVRQVKIFGPVRSLDPHPVEFFP